MLMLLRGILLLSPFYCLWRQFGLDDGGILGADFWHQNWGYALWLTTPFWILFYATTPKYLTDAQSGMFLLGVCALLYLALGHGVYPHLIEIFRIKQVAYQPYVITAPFVVCVFTLTLSGLFHWDS